MARDVTKLHPILQYKLEQLKNVCEREGLKIGIADCVRTSKEQDELYAKGRTKPGGIVTNAKGSTFGSMHQWGIAFDFYRNDGKGAYNEADCFFQRVGTLAKSVGLEWGGDWTSFPDKPHIQLPYWGSGAGTLKRSHGTPERFFASWKPAIPTKTVKKGSSKNDILWLQQSLCRATTMKIAIDGLWGNETSNAVVQYQKMLGWNATGKAGTKTIQALKRGRNS